MASRVPKHQADVPENVTEKARMERLVLELDVDQKRALTPSIGRGYAGVVRGIIEDSLSMFALPAPIRAVLEEDMRERGIARQRDYVVWLLLERERVLRPEPAVSGAA